MAKKGPDDPYGAPLHIKDLSFHGLGISTIPAANHGYQADRDRT